MGKMKREYESLIEQGYMLGDEMERNAVKKYTATPNKLSNKIHDPYNLWDTDDRGDNRVDMDKLWEDL